MQGIRPARPVQINPPEVVQHARCLTCTDVTNGKTQLFQRLTAPATPDTTPASRSWNSRDARAQSLPPVVRARKPPYSKTNALIATGSFALCCNRMILAE